MNEHTADTLHDIHDLYEHGKFDSFTQLLDEITSRWGEEKIEETYQTMCVIFKNNTSIGNFNRMTGAMLLLQNVKR
jgi:hypothetical protein